MISILLTFLVLGLNTVEGRCYSCPQFVEKSAISTNVRFVFVAGLEGTGHHAMSSMLTACAPLCKPVGKTIQALLYSHGAKPKGVFVYGDQTAASIKDKREELLKELKKLANTKTPTAFIMNTIGGGDASGMMSYPNYSGNDKTLHHPNVHELAVLAEAAGVDFRVIVLQRNSHEMRLSDVDHRHFGTEAHETAVLADNAAALTGQLSLLDPQFFVCIRYHMLDSVDVWQQIVAPALHPGMTEYAARMAAKAKSKPSTPLSLQDMDVFELHLEAMNSLLMHQCSESAFAKPELSTHHQPVR